MNEPIEPGEIEIRDLFPTLSEEQLKAKRAFLYGYFETLLSGYKLNRFSWLEKHGKSSWEPIC